MARDPAFEVASWNGDAWRLNGRRLRGAVCDYLDDRSGSGVPSQTECQICSAQNLTKDFIDLATSEAWHNNRQYYLAICSRCAHWELVGYEGGNRCMDDQVLMVASSVTAKFHPDLPRDCSAELAQHLRQNPNLWNALTPRRLEILVADIFRANYGNAEVIHVGGPGDRGIDVVLVDARDTEWLVQVKRHARGGAEGFATLQSIVGTLTLEGKRHGIVVSTATTFSYQARRAQGKANQLGYMIKLIDRGKLDRLVGQLLPAIPWHLLTRSLEFGHVGLDVWRHFDADFYEQSILFRE